MPNSPHVHVEAEFSSEAEFDSEIDDDDESFDEDGPPSDESSDYDPLSPAASAVDDISCDQSMEDLSGNLKMFYNVYFIFYSLLF